MTSIKSRGNVNNSASITYRTLSVNDKHLMHAECIRRVWNADKPTWSGALRAFVYHHDRARQQAVLENAIKSQFGDENKKLILRGLETPSAEQILQLTAILGAQTPYKMLKCLRGFKTEDARTKHEMLQIKTNGALEYIKDYDFYNPRSDMFAEMKNVQPDVFSDDQKTAFAALQAYCETRGMKPPTLVAYLAARHKEMAVYDEPAPVSKRQKTETTIPDLNQATQDMESVPESMPPGPKEDVCLTAEEAKSAAIDALGKSSYDALQKMCKENAKNFVKALADHEEVFGTPETVAEDVEVVEDAVLAIFAKPASLPAWLVYHLACSQGDVHSGMDANQKFEAVRRFVEDICKPNKRPTTLNFKHAAFQPNGMIAIGDFDCKRSRNLQPGVFATEDIKAGKVIHAYTGVVFRDQAELAAFYPARCSVQDGPWYDARTDYISNAEEYIDGEMYLHFVVDGARADESGKLSPMLLINHSNTAVNVHPEVIKDQGPVKLALVAVTDIPAGLELKTYCGDAYAKKIADRYGADIGQDELTTGYIDPKTLS